MSEELIRQNQDFVDETLGPYFRGLREEIAQENLSSLDTPGQLATMLAQAHFQDSLRVGTQIIFSEVPHLANFQEFEKDWQSFVACVQETFSYFAQREAEGEDENEPSEHETMQDALAITPQLMQVFYQLGVDAYQDRDVQRSLGIMGLVSLLNPFLFEPWLVQGIVHTQNKNLAQALFTLTMAAIVNYNHPASHLCMAQVYLDMGTRADAESSLEVAEFYLPDCSEPQWQEFAKNLKYQLSNKAK